MRRRKVKGRKAARENMDSSQGGEIGDVDNSNGDVDDTNGDSKVTLDEIILEL